MSHELNLKQMKKEWHGSLKSYAIGFIASLILTAISFVLVVFRPISDSLILYIVAFLAFAQAIIQLLFFLHLGQEAKPKWETFIFYFMVVVLLIIVLGSLWIMNDLHYRVMSDMGTEMHHD